MNIVITRRIALVPLLTLLTCGTEQVMGARASFQAEEMTADVETWMAQAHYTGWYTGQPIGEMLRGSRGGQGQASYDITLGPGDWRLWVRYLDVRTARGPFRVSATQDGNLLGDKVFDEETRHANSGHYAMFSWDFLDVLGVTEYSPVRITVSKEDPIDCYGHARQLDLFVLADDPDYVPNTGDFYRPLWLKVRFREGHPRRSRIYVFGKTPPNPGVYPGNYFVDRRGLGKGLGLVESALLDPGESSPWVNIAPLLPPTGLSTVRFRAITTWTGDSHVDGADFELYLANDPDDDAIFKQFARDGSGASLTLAIDPEFRDDIRCELAWSREALAVARALSPPIGRRPKRFPLQTGLNVYVADNPSETINNELEIMQRLGFSGLFGGGQIDPRFLESGLVCPASGSIYWGQRDNGCFSCPHVDAIRKQVTNAFVSACAAGVVPDQLAYFQFMDEPTAASLEHITNCAACAEGFRSYLRNRPGLSPEHFGRVAWTDIAPSADREDARVYYWTAQYRMQQVSDFFKIGTEALQQHDPNIRTTVNFLQPSYCGNLVSYGVDWFSLLGDGGLTYGWNQDWSNFQVSYQIAGYDWSMLRAACRGSDSDWGGYTIIRTLPWDTVTKAVAKIGYGARATHFFNYGPKYLISTDQYSHCYPLYPAFSKVNHVIGVVEDYIMDGRPWNASRVALLYSHSSDIWHQEEAAYLQGKERQFMWLLLRHLGYAPEIITEADLRNGQLGGYDLIMAHGSHLEAQAATALAAWVRAGGTLYLGAGSLQFDHYNQALDFEKQLGVERGGCDLEGRPLHPQDINHLGGRTVLATAMFQGHLLEEVCGRHTLMPWDGAQALLAFNDGEPAMVTGPAGVGRVITAGFFPGIGYARGGVAARTERDADVTYNPPSFPSGYRALLEFALDGLVERLPVTTSHYLVEAGLLESPHGRLVTLVNWSGAPIEHLQVRIHAPGHVLKPATIVNPGGNVLRQGDDWLLTLDLNDFELIALPLHDSLPVNPVPVPEAEEVSLQTVLCWSGSPLAEMYALYLGISHELGPENLLGKTTTTTFDPGLLDSDTTYYWRVDSIVSHSIVTGNVWRFTTQTPDLVIQDLPHTESFESFIVGQRPPPSDGWEITGIGPVRVANIANVLHALTNHYSGSLPLETTHTQYLYAGSNSQASCFLRSPSNAVVVTDFMLLPKRHAPGTTPPIPLKAQLALAVNAEGRLMVLHGTSTDGEVFKPEWHTLEGTEILPSEQWVRISLLQNYRTMMYQVRLNLSPALSDDKGCTRPGDERPGTWFRMARSGAQRMNEFGMQQCVCLDDLRVFQKMGPGTVVLLANAIDTAF